MISNGLVDPDQAFFDGGLKMATTQNNMVDAAIIEGILVDIDPDLDDPKCDVAGLAEALQPGLSKAAEALRLVLPQPHGRAALRRFVGDMLAAC